MKKVFLLFCFAIAISNLSYAQPANGSVAPDFTVTDINGNSHNLYTYLNQGKTVYLDFFATWCTYCWQYHQTHALQDLYTQYGPAGTNEAVVIAIEASASTNLACISGSAGCNSSTYGNWTAGVTYPVVSDESLNTAWNIGGFPTIVMICPQDKKVWNAGQSTAAALWALRFNKCINGNIPLTISLIQRKDVICHNTNTGKVDILVNGGLSPYSYQWSNGSTFQDIIDVPAGTYSVTVTASNGATSVGGPWVVANPPSPLTVQGAVVAPSGCNNLAIGSVQANPSGGWSNYYSFKWNNNQTTAAIAGLTPGLYFCTVTDDKGCTKSQSVSLQQAPPPGAVITPPTSGAIVTCANPNVPLTASGPASANSLGFAWTALAGNIVSGASSATATVNQGGAYQVVVTDNVTSCTSEAFINVSENTIAPSCSATPQAFVSCTTPTASLVAIANTGAQYTYAWTASNGGVILTGANSLNATVGAAGTYTFVVTNSINGCTASAVSIVSVSGTIPTVTATGGALSCSTTSVTLNATSNTAGVSYGWTGPNGFTSLMQNPTVTVPGTYNVAVLAPNGCTGAASVTVTADTNAPAGVTASGATLSCSTPTATLSASTTTAGATYTWTGPSGFTSIQQNPTVSNAGQYTLVVTGPNGCTATATASVTSNAAVPSAQVSSTATSLNCNTNQAVLTVNVTPSANYTYQWTTTNGVVQSGSTSAAATVTAAGIYQVLVTNPANGCSSTASFTLSQTAAVAAGITSQSNVLCNGGATGSATVSASGGTGTYSYSWSNGQTGATLNNLPAGSYTVIASDAQNCTSSATVQITQPTVLVINASATAQTIAGQNNGTASVTASGGTAPYTYAWSTGATAAQINQLAPGTYTVVVTDNNGCTKTSTVSVQSVNCAISAAIATTSVRCFGGADGTATATITGAAAPVTFAWSNGSTTPNQITGLAAGTYTLTATDASSCQAIQTFTISSPAALAVGGTPNVTNTQCAGQSTGAISLGTVSGGTSPYVVSWSNGATGASIGNLMAGTYTPVVTDANGCTLAPGAITVSATDNVAPTMQCPSNITKCAAENIVTFALPVVTDNCTVNDQSLVQTAGPASGTAFPVGQTTVSYRYTDAGNNVVNCSFNVTITNPAAATLQNVTNDIGGQGVGGIQVTVAGGTGALTYAWTNAAGQVVSTSQNASGLVAGTYTLRITDQNGCVSAPLIVTVQNSVSASEPAWMQQVMMMPNPATHEVVLHMHQANLPTLTVTLLDMTGRQVRVLHMENASASVIPLVDLAEGTYFVRLQSGNEVGYRKLIKQ